MDGKGLILYKHSNGKILVWAITPDYANGELIIQTGRVKNGQPSYSKRVNHVTIKPMGGRTMPQQIQQEYNVRVNKKRRSGYNEDPNIISVPLLPMRPVLMSKPTDIKYPCIVQPKLDGISCIATIQDGNVVLLTRNAKPIQSVPHIKQQVVSVLQYLYNMGIQTPRIIGELYIHGLALQMIRSITSRLESNLHDDYLHMEYHVFDMMINAPTDTRLQAISTAIDNSMCANIKCVPYVMANDYSHVSMLFNECINMGYEGVVLKRSINAYNPNECGYVSDKNKTSLKLKGVYDEESTIIGYKYDNNGFIILIVQRDNGVQFAITPGGTEYERYQMDQHRDDLMGKRYSYRYRSLTNDGVPVHITPIGIRK